MNNPEQHSLWPDGPPDGLLQHTQAEIFPNHTESDQRLNRMYGWVSSPTFSLHQPPSDKNTGTAVVIFPGGGYRDVWIDKEGYDAGRWLNRLGMTAIVVKYRTGPQDESIFGNEKLMAMVMKATLADAKRVMRIVRHNATQWNIAPNRIGTMGFSAGGHLILRLAAQADKGNPNGGDDIEQQDCTPDFTIAIYPALPQELPTDYVKLNPLFMAVAGDDMLTPAHGTAQAAATLLQENVDVELHVFRSGSHGFGMGLQGGPSGYWMNLCEAWLRDLKLI
ncbi:MAG: alpha/beta hydrolase [Chloroflexota bacterium]